MADQDQLAELIAKLQKAEARAATAEGELLKVNTSFGEKIKALTLKAQEAEAQVGQIKLQGEMDRTLMADGITDEAAIDYIRYSYSRAPKVGETAPSFTDFYTGYKEEKKDFLSSFRPKAATATKTDTAGTQAQTKVEPKGPNVAAGTGAAQVGNAGKGAVDPSVGAKAQQVSAGAMDPSQLANMKPADAMAFLRSQGLARPAVEPKV